MPTDALADVLPAVARNLPRAPLGVWPTPLEPLGPVTGTARDADLWVKREDLSSPAYGGNKIRCLETVLGDLLDRGVRRAWTTGAYGSNQAVALAIHAPRVGIRPGAVLFPQPPATAARENLEACLAVGAELRLMSHMAAFPYTVGREALRARRSDPPEAVIAPGAATPRGALGHLTAALEVALAVEAGAAPPPRHVLLPVGSTCTLAGLLVGFHLAAFLGLGFRDGPPRLLGVRVTPWPVTAHWRVVLLAVRTAAFLHALGGPDLRDPLAVSRSLEVAGGYLGRGYGHPTQAGREALRRFAAAGAPPLDTTYSAKAAAALLDRLGSLDGPILFWSTKSSAPLPAAGAAQLAAAPRRARRWLRRELRADGPRTLEPSAPTGRPR